MRIENPEQKTDFRHLGESGVLLGRSHGDAYSPGTPYWSSPSHPTRQPTNQQLGTRFQHPHSVLNAISPHPQADRHRLHLTHRHGDVNELTAGLDESLVGQAPPPYLLQAVRTNQTIDRPKMEILIYDQTNNTATHSTTPPITTRPHPPSAMGRQLLRTSRRSPTARGWRVSSIDRLPHSSGDIGGWLRCMDGWTAPHADRAPILAVSAAQSGCAPDRLLQGWNRDCSSRQARGGIFVQDVYGVCSVRE